MRVLAPPDGWSAVVRGALAKVLSQASPTIPRILITSHIARLHHGHLRRTLFDPLLHERNRAYHATIEAKLDADLQQLIPIEIGYDGEKDYVVKFKFHAPY
ncbi:hypothetical protein N7539_005108 [Penicillium diatomitis]|uniref:Uncharacterized protein n=1 Tax=Penicillium diatomitis TaxID=2819901 RepID=A0A9W9X692_9EURO|nr:uncharacterized protein N7539_005108 [Penicillium diatomitis]KAJ5485120.1 hypothetical protein N7539_005108 [Penicillium diatomitis]